MDPEALHGAERARDAPVGHVPQGVVGGLGVQGDEVPEGVVGALGLRDLPVGVRFGGVHDVRELDRVLDEEHRDVVADQVEDALAGVELRREAAGVPDGVGGAAGAEHGGEADEHRRLHALGEEGRLRHVRRRAVAAEHPVRRGAAGVDHALGDAFMVEVHDLFPQVVVLQQHRATGSRLERVVRVVQPGALGVGQESAALRPPCLVGAGRLPGGGDGLRAGLVGLGRERLMAFGRLGDRRGPGTRLSGDALLRARAVAPQDVRRLLRRSLQGVRLAHRCVSFAGHTADRQKSHVQA